MGLFDLKILHCCKVYLPENGGVQQVAYRLSQLLKDKFEFSVLTTARYSANEKLEGVLVTRVRSYFSILSLPIAPNYFVQLFQAHKLYDLVVLHYPFPLLDVFYALCAKPKETKLIVLWHSDIVGQRFAKIFVTPFTKLMLRKADKVIVASPPIQGNSPILKGLPAGRVEIAPFPSMLDETKIDVNNIEYRNFILCVGRHVRYKGIHVLLKAVATTKEHLVVVGKGDDNDNHEQLRKNMQLAKDLGIEERVHFVVNASDKELKEYYRTCKALVLPSITPNEAFGLVQVEAMMYAKPVVNTNLKSGVPWVTSDLGDDLTVPPDDAIALSRAIQKLSLEYCQKMGPKFRAVALKKFGSDTCIERYMAIFAGR